jgi:hypothetical protein
MPVYHLRPHPAAATTSADKVSVEVERTEASWTLDFVATGRDILWPQAALCERADELWRTTCFELFVRSVGSDAYVEFNFSPSTRWAAYAFDSYRAGMRDLTLAVPPRIERTDSGIRVNLAASALPPSPSRVSVSAAIEHTDGNISYWALAHPAEKPDFHDAACFVIEVPAVA